MKLIAKQLGRRIVSLVVMLPASVLAGTVLHWSFDGTNGNSLTANTDNVAGVTVSKFNDSTLSGGATNLVKFGPPNPWYNTNGTSANFLNTVAVNDPGVGLFKTDTGANSTLDLTGPSSLTIETFVYLYDLRQAVVIRKTDSSANGYYIDVRPTGNFAFRLNSTEVVVSNTAITTNTWYHVALVRDGISNQARFYIDGLLKTNVGLTGSMPDTPNGLGIGAIVRDNVNPPANTGQFFFGRIDEVRISDTALTPPEFLLSQIETNVEPPGVIVFDKTETFDTANSASGHGWVELGSRTNGQNYGFSATTNAGGLAGEAGGSMSRKALRSSYCDVFGTPLGLDNVIRANGRFVLIALPLSGNASVLFGHGDSTKTGLNNEANQMGLVLATTPPSFFSHLTFADGYRWEENVASGLTVNQMYAWEYEYDSADNGGLGSFTTRITALGSGITNFSVRYLDASLRNRGAAFDSFGITQRGLSDLTPAPVSQSFIDDVTYSAASNGPSVQFTALTSSILETTGAGTLNVALSQVLTQTVTVQYSVTGGTATGDDYSLANGMLTFPPGVTNRSIPFSVIADGLTELDETIEVSLSAPTGVGLGPRFKHTITIINVDLLKLHIEKLNQDLGLKWPVSFWNYRLQSRSNLSASSSWVDVTNSVAIANGWRQVVLPPTNTSGFFRLAQNLGELPTFTNSIGMKMVQLPAGVFTMGYWQSTALANEILDVEYWVPSLGDFDEKPAHQATISRPFWIGAYEVSNLEYEQFDPGHAALRGKLGFSTNNNEAVVFISWTDAEAFCDWLSAREGRSYRLPTEAEWEYACRAGTTTHFFTGDTLPSQYLNNPGFSWWPTADSPTGIFRGQTPPNQWGLYDMHGNVEEWCSDWYGPYTPDPQVDPVGRADGLAKVTRGGSHSTVAFYLRSANRMGTLPADKSWYIGLRVVIGDAPLTSPLPATPPADYQLNVSQSVPSGITNSPNPSLPYFRGPWQYVKIPAGSFGPLYSTHNHDPGGIVECPNGDLFAIWYTCVTEPGRELALAASRLRYGSTNWDNASFFYDMPDRNDHTPGLGFDGDQTLYQFAGLSAAATWGPLALTLSTSTDNGVTWTKPRLISPEHNKWHQPIASFSKMTDGTLLIPSDAGTGGSGGSVIWLSRDSGLTWFNPATGRPTPSFTQGNTGAWIAGIHAPVAEVGAGQLIAFGRGNSIGGMMPKSVSSDGGTNWTYSASVFQPVGGGQRATLLRLREGPLFLASFGTGVSITDASGGTRTVSGLFAALSYDGGVTWPYIRLVSDDEAVRSVETTDGTAFTMGFSSAEPRGYITSIQGKNHIIHLISSRQHYQFNLKWLETRPPSTPVSP